MSAKTAKEVRNEQVNLASADLIYPYAKARKTS
jgi:hypothetical protein